MPFIRVSANVAVNEGQAQRIKTLLGQAIEVIPGKSEAWLMVEVEGEKALWMAGSDAPAAIAEVSVYGGADAEDYRQLTGRVCDILDSVLDVPADREVRRDGALGLERLQFLNAPAKEGGLFPAPQKTEKAGPAPCLFSFFAVHEVHGKIAGDQQPALLVVQFQLVHRGVAAAVPAGRLDGDGVAGFCAPDVVHRRLKRDAGAAPGAGHHAGTGVTQGEQPAAVGVAVKIEAVLRDRGHSLHIARPGDRHPQALKADHRFDLGLQHLAQLLLRPLRAFPSHLFFHPSSLPLLEKISHGMVLYTSRQKMQAAARDGAADNVPVPAAPFASAGGAPTLARSVSDIFHDDGKCPF